METKKQLRKEKSLMRKKATRPIGMPELSGSFDRLIEEAWEHRVVENDLHFDTELGQQLNEEELLQSAVADEANIMYSNKKLNTESIQAMIDPKGYLTSEAAEYNCKLLDEQYPESKFIYLSQFLAKKEVRELHALELNLKTYKHLHFIFNRSNKQIFDTQQLGGHHYAIATIRADGNVFFGDSLYKNIPSNLKNVLTEYYYIKFEKPLEKIINLSGRKNFPRQTDSNLCGFIALMIMTLVENETILELFNSSVNFSELRNNSFLIFKPSLYNLYLRQVFMKAYSVSSLMQNMFVTETGFALINQFVTQVEKPLNPEGFQEKFVSIPGNHKKQASDCIQPKTPPPKNSYQSISEAAEDILTNNDLDEKTEADVSKIVDEVVQSDFVGKIVLKNTKCNLRSNYKIDSDGFQWKKKNLNGRNKKVLYVCTGLKDGKECTAEKVIYTPFGSSFSKGEKIVEYVSSHPFCKPKLEIIHKMKKTEYERIKKHTSSVIQIDSRRKILKPTLTVPFKSKKLVESDKEASKSAAKEVSKVASKKKAVAKEVSKLAAKEVYKVASNKKAVAKEVSNAAAKEIYKAAANEASKAAVQEVSKAAAKEVSKANTSVDIEDVSDGKELFEMDENTRIDEEEYLQNSFNASVNKCTDNDNSVEMETTTKETSCINESARVEIEDVSDHSDGIEIFDMDDKKKTPGRKETSLRISLNKSVDEHEATEIYPSHETADNNEYNKRVHTEQYEQYINFEVKKKSIKLRKYFLNKPLLKYFVETSCAVLVHEYEGTNVDCHAWRDFHGGHGNGYGITTSTCKDSQSCQLKKKKWCCVGKCLGNRFCCQIYSNEAIHVSVFLGNHDHQIDSSKFLSLEVAVNEGEDSEGRRKESSEVENTLHEEESSDAEYSSNESSVEDFANLSIGEGIHQRQTVLSKYERIINKRCLKFFKGKEIINAKQNEIEASVDKVYIIKMSNHEKISSVAKDGYIYESNTTRKKMPEILDEQGLSYSYQCQGKLVCHNGDCPVLNRLTVMNSFPMKKSSERKCRFCKSILEKEECEGRKYILRSKESNSKKSKYIVIKYERNHSCGQPEPVLDQLVVEELKTLFESNPEMTPSNAYKSLLDKKIREKKSYKEILNVVHAFTHDHKAKNIKAGVKRGLNPSGDELACILELQKFLSDKPELEIILKVYTDSFICGICDFYSVTSSLEPEINNQCKKCQIDMQHTGPMILLTSLDQVKSAEQMTDGAFQFSSLFLDHQNGRIINYNSFNAYFYDFHVQSISSVFTVHSMFEDQYSVCLSFKLFDEVYRSSLDKETPFKPHGFSSDNAGAICAGIQKHFGMDVLHRTCSFHYLFGAYNHCSNAIGQRDSQVRYLRYSWKLLEATTPTKFELIYKFFKAWIQKSKSRNKKLGPWLKFWYDRKIQWASAFTSLTVDAVNLAEAGQSKYKKTNRMKRLKLYQGCVYEIGDSLLYSSRLKAMTSLNFVGKGPSKEILDLRASKKAMARIKDQFMTEKNLEELFTYLGIKSKKRHVLKVVTSTPIKTRPFLKNDIEALDEALDSFQQDPNAPYTYKSPKIKNPFKASKPGRPKGSKKRKPNKNDTISSETSIETSGNDSEFSSGPEEDMLHARKRKRNAITYSSSSDGDDNNLGNNSERMQLRKRKCGSPPLSVDGSGDIQPTGRKNIKNSDFHSGGEKEKSISVASNKNSKSKSEASNDNESNEIHETNIQLGRKQPRKRKRVNFQINDSGSGDLQTGGKKVKKNHESEDESDPNVMDVQVGRKSSSDMKETDVKNQDKKITRFSCRMCNEESTSKIGVRAHYIIEHAWKNFEYSAIMKQPHQSMLGLYTVSKQQFLCSCGKKSPGRILQSEDPDLLGRQWLLIHRLVDPPHFKEELGRGLKTFPSDLIVELDENSSADSSLESKSSGDLSLPEVSKYFQKPLDSLENEEIAAKILINSSVSDEDHEKLPPLKKPNEMEFKAKKNRTKDTKSYTALKKKAKAEALNYAVELKIQNSDSFIFELRNKNNKNNYVVSFLGQSVTCNCESFKEIELRRWETSNEVCKHVPIVILFCHENVQDGYHGQRFFSTRSTFVCLSEMFQSFDPNRNLLEKKRHVNFSLYPTPIPCPVKRYPYFSKKDYALNYLAKLTHPSWFAEKYNRESAQGEKPTCKSCSAKIDIGTLCLRIDSTQVFQNKNYRKDDFTMKMSPFRICIKQQCFTDVNNKIRSNDFSRSNIGCIESIDLANIFDEDKATVKRMFINVVTFIHDS